MLHLYYFFKTTIAYLYHFTQFTIRGAIPFLVLLLSCTSSPKVQDSILLQSNSDDSFIGKVISHYTKQLKNGKDVFGDDSTAFWMASLDTYSGTYPEDISRPEHIPQRAYLDRYVDAPRGSTLYWDMPAIVAINILTDLTGDKIYKESADDYIKAFLARCVAKNGVFLWGNHYYYDAFMDSTMKFSYQPTPIDFNNEIGGLHELRPFAPAWDAFWEIDSIATELEIRQSVKQHVSDEATGEFNRHANDERGHAFLESGGVLVYNLAWLFRKTGDVSLLEQADRIASFNFNDRTKSTGLLTNDPTSNRWDNVTSTTEVGLWTGYLLAAAKMADQHHRDKWIQWADEAMSSWLVYGYDSQEEKYYGMLDNATGAPIFRKEDDDYPYKPGNYSDLWEPLFPTHNYPMSFAESCLELYKLTNKEKYKLACQWWVQLIENSLPARDGAGAYAEHYGRVIHFLLSCAEVFNEDIYKALATRIAHEAVDVLFAHDMFRSHPGEYRYDAVDGVGILSLSLIWLETGERPDQMGLFF